MTLSPAAALEQLQAALGPVEQWTPETRAQINAIREGLYLEPLPVDHAQVLRDLASAMETFAAHIDPALSVTFHGSTYTNEQDVTLLGSYTMADALALVSRLGFATDGEPRPVGQSLQHRWRGSLDGFTFILAWSETSPARTTDASDEASTLNPRSSASPVADERVTGDAGPSASPVAEPGPATTPVEDDEPTHRFNDHREPDGRWCLWSHVAVREMPTSTLCPIGCPTSSVVAVEVTA